METTYEKIQLDGLQAIAITWRANGWTLRYDTNTESFCLRDIEARRVYGVACDRSYGPWWVMFLSDCFDPPMYIVRADNESDAVDEFLEEFGHLCRIDESDLEDYRDGDEYRCDFDPSGNPCDTESLQLFRAELVSAEF